MTYKLAPHVTEEMLKEVGFDIEKECAFKTVKDETCCDGENQVVIDFEEDNEIYLNLGNNDVSPFSKGIADKPDSDMHINYYLIDYESKNPYDDFNIIGLLEDYLK